MTMGLFFSARPDRIKLYVILKKAGVNLGFGLPSCSTIKV
jgi:hypothetical protein